MINIGIIGMGIMGKIHADLAKSTGEINIIAACENNPQRIENIKNTCDFDIYSDLDRFLEIKDMDHVIISTSNITHEDLAIKALAAGKNVLIEKPLSIDYESALRILEKACETGKRVSVFQSRRWDADFLKIKEIIESGLLGDLLDIQSRFYTKIWDPEVNQEKQWRFDERGGGLLFDWGSHLIDQILFLMKKEPSSVYGLLQKSSRDLSVEDYFLGILEFKNNTICKVEARNSSRLRMPRWYVVGTKGTLLVRNKKDYVWDEIELEYEDKKGREIKEKIKLPGVERFSEDIYKDFVKFIKGEKKVFVDINEAVTVMKIIDLIKLSNKDKKIIKDVNSWGEEK